MDPSHCGTCMGLEAVSRDIRGHVKATGSVVGSGVMCGAPGLCSHCLVPDSLLSGLLSVQHGHACVKDVHRARFPSRLPRLLPWRHFGAPMPLPPCHLWLDVNSTEAERGLRTEL